MWNGKTQVFYYIRNKLGQLFIDRAPYDSDVYAIFVPLRKIDLIE